jgi:hypothetical protein
MKLGKNKLSALVGAVLSLGVAGQASADVYGVSYLDIDNLTIDISSLTGAGLFTFSTNQDATLNGASDLSSGAASCGGLFGVSNTCGGAAPRLSGTVQNAPGGGVARGENDYTVFGQGADFSNSEAAIVRATLLGDGTTQATAISESNLNAGTSAQANTLVQSNTNLQLNFTVSGTGTFSIEFDADINVQAEVTGGDLGIAQANSSVTVLLQRNGVTIASWLLREPMRLPRVVLAIPVQLLKLLCL